MYAKSEDPGESAHMPPPLTVAISKKKLVHWPAYPLFYQDSDKQTFDVFLIQKGQACFWFHEKKNLIAPF